METGKDASKGPGMPGSDVPTQGTNPGTKEHVPGRPSSQADPGPDEGMEEKPDTGDSARPYDVNARDADPYQPAERPQETAQMMDQPREALDESAVKKGPMENHQTAEAPSDMKSTDQLDRNYNDPEAARQDVI
ncbi:hypothetical protein [Larkinella soli]|uniref:hypothetical protein n=1 Tax=Larkinella soli TaxID=1770527 RepID=UPI000FFB2960|nr:hypothetical protein [Larkinella soli]